MDIKKNLSRNWSEKIPVSYPETNISYAETKIPVSYPKNPINYPIMKIPVSYPETPGINEKSSVPEESNARDPAFHYEVTKGQFGNNSRQSITYRGKKTRWR